VFHKPENVECLCSNKFFQKENTTVVYLPYDIFLTLKFTVAFQSMAV